jgi:MFS family permease
MINIWGTTFLVGPFLGPALAGYIQQGTNNWRAVFAVLTGLYGLSTLMIVLFARETYYNRTTLAQQRNRVRAFLAIGNTNLPKLSTITSSTANIIKLIFTPPILLIGISTMINFTWPIGITTTIDAILHSPPYLMNSITSASMRFAGVIGALLGFVVGHFFNSWIYNGSHGKRKANWRSEYRLHGIWIPILSMVCGLLAYGLTFHYQKSWVGLAFGWILVNVGLVGSMVASTAFALEKYPEHASKVAAILNMWRTCGGFAVGYFQPSWIARNGAAVVYAVQAAIVAVSVVGLVGSVISMGRIEARRKMRARNGGGEGGVSRIGSESA